MSKLLVVGPGAPIFHQKEIERDRSQGLRKQAHRIGRWGLAMTLMSLGSCGNGESDALRRVDAALEADPVLKQYLIAQDALAGDRVDEAIAALHHLSGSAPEPVQGLVARTKGADVDSVRVSFESISEYLINRKPLVDGLRVAHCPMAFDYKGARWIQYDSEVTNPYFGARMLHCGVFADVAAEAITQE